MARVELSATASAGGPSVEVNGRTITAKPATARVSIVLENDLELSDDAAARITGVLAREAKRFAEIAFVDARDQQVATTEAERIRNLPKERPHLIAGLGSKEPDSVIVTKGEYEITFEGKPRKMVAPRGGSR